MFGGIDEMRKEWDEWKKKIEEYMKDRDQSDRIEILLWIVLIKMHELFWAEGAEWEVDE